MLGTLGEIRLFAGIIDDDSNRPPRGWEVCDGRLLPIGSYQPLYSAIGAVYGGDGIETFALPDLRSRVPVGNGTASRGLSYAIGEAAGAEEVPTEPVTVDVENGSGVTVQSVIPTRGNNVQPVLGLHYIICVYGEFPFDD